jgi:HSP20 family protein
MSLTATSDPPFSNLGRVSKMTEQMMQKGYFNFCPSETWTPSVNLYETDHSYLVCVDLAGVDKEKIDIEVLDNQLTLRGTREVPMNAEMQQQQSQATSGTAAAVAPHDESGGGTRRPRVHLMEIDHGAFCRQVELPADIARERITAQYLNGMLWIEIPKG